jgi:peptide/nickel transport system ATP-binding protein
MAEALLSVEGLEVTYHVPDLAGRSRSLVRAVTGVSFTLDRHETVGVVGESGSGKSTLARALVGLVKPSAGTIRIDGVALRPGRVAGRGMQMVFQDHTSTLNPFQPVRRILGDVLRLARPGLGRSEEEAQATALLHKVGLGADALGRLPHTFSGGQRQRIAIARSLAAAPRLVICDEPTSALDVSVQAQVLDVFAGLKAEGQAMLFISHNLAVVRQVADRILVMYRGAIVEEGPADRVIRAPTHPYTRRLVYSAPRLTNRGALLAAARTRIEETMK